MSPLELIAAHPWRRAAFTTYALSLAFFEAVVLDALVRGGGRQAMIIADVDGVRAALSEQGARRAGRDYEVEPVKVSRGVFHPKVTVLTGEGQSHLLVGSGNLTFGGWGANLEVIEHLHPSFAADAFEDAADFFENIASSDALRHGVTENCGVIAEELRTAAATGAATGNIRLFHSLNGSISDRLVEVADDLGGATRLVVASPFWDHGAGLDWLCEGLGLDEAFVHAHPGGVVEGTAGANWPRAPRRRVNAVVVEPLEGETKRRLHAKMFEVVCRRGRIQLSGSANATGAALGAGNNVEACIARIQRDRLVGWSFSPSTPLEISHAVDDPAAEIEEVVGILRATLEGDRIAGQVLAPHLAGAAEVFQLSAAGPAPLTQTQIDQDGSFDFDAPGLELQSWKSGRLVVRVTTPDGRSAEGFVSVAAFSHMTRRAGAMAPRLLAMLAGTETPADVAAIMSWLHEDPSRLALSAHPTAGGKGAGGGATSPDARVALSELVATPRPPWSDAGRREDPGEATWTRFMSHVLACLREPRGPFGRAGTGRAGEDDDDDDLAPETAKPDPGVARAFANFERLFDDWLSPAKAARLGPVLFSMTLYVCERLSPDARQARGWIERLVDEMPRSAQTDELRDELAAVILALLSLETDPPALRQARGRLLRFGVDLGGAPPNEDGTAGLKVVLGQQSGFIDLWAEVQKVRTLGEQAAAYVDALHAGATSCDCPDLAVACHKEWPLLLEALASDRARKRVLVLSAWSEACPRCNSVLPKAEVHNLRQHCVATALNCCGRVIVFGGR